MGAESLREIYENAERFRNTEVRTLPGDPNIRIRTLQSQEEAGLSEDEYGRAGMVIDETVRRFLHMPNNTDAWGIRVTQDRETGELTAIHQANEIQRPIIVTMEREYGQLETSVFNVTGLGVASQ